MTTNLIIIGVGAALLAFLFVMAASFVLGYRVGVLRTARVAAKVLEDMRQEVDLLLSRQEAVARMSEREERRR